MYIGKIFPFYSMLCTFAYMYHADVFIHVETRGRDYSWKWIESLYLEETSTETPGVRLGFKLTRDHVWLNSFTRMRVYLAAQCAQRKHRISSFHNKQTMVCNVLVYIVVYSCMCCV